MNLILPGSNTNKWVPSSSSGTSSVSVLFLQNFYWVKWNIDVSELCNEETLLYYKLATVSDRSIDSDHYFLHYHIFLLHSVFWNTHFALCDLYFFEVLVLLLLWCSAAVLDIVFGKGLVGKQGFVDIVWKSRIGWTLFPQREWLHWDI